MSEKLKTLNSLQCTPKARLLRIFLLVFNVWLYLRSSSLTNHPAILKSFVFISQLLESINHPSFVLLACPGHVIYTYTMGEFKNSLQEKANTFLVESFKKKNTYFNVFCLAFF